MPTTTQVSESGTPGRVKAFLTRPMMGMGAVVLVVLVVSHPGQLRCPTAVEATDRVVADRRTPGRVTSCRDPGGHGDESKSTMTPICRENLLLLLPLI